MPLMGRTPQDPNSPLHGSQAVGKLRFEALGEKETITHKDRILQRTLNLNKVSLYHRIRGLELRELWVIWLSQQVARQCEQNLPSHE